MKAQTVNSSAKLGAFLLFVVVAFSVAGSVRAVVLQGRSQEITVYLLAEETGQPLKGTIHFYYQRTPRHSVGETAFSGEDGAAILRGIPRSAVFMVGTVKGYGHAVAFLIANPGTPQVVELTLPKAATVEGIVTDSNGIPADGVRVSIQYLDKLADRLYEVQDVVDQALAEGLPITTVEPTVRTLSGRSRAAILPNGGYMPGGFTLREIGPRRPFRIVCEHEELGTIQSSVMYLEAGETYSEMSLSYQYE